MFYHCMDISKIYFNCFISPVAKMVKNPPAMWEAWVWSLGWEDLLEEVTAAHSSILAWKIPMDKGTWQATTHGGRKELDTTEWLSTIKVKVSVVQWRKYKKSENL